MASKNKRNSALASLAADFNQDVETSERTDVQTLEKPQEVKEVPVAKPKSRAVSNIPWYPKSQTLKKELKLLALHEGSSLTALIDEGIAMVLKKRGKDIKDYM